MSAIFISYRREDAEDSARALYESLVPVFGKERLFMDVEAIALGSDFRDAIEHSLDNCGVFLAIIGPTWLDVKNPDDPAGQCRLDDPGDYVRLEVSTALKRGSSLPVIPVLVRGANMPPAAKLPEDLRNLTYRNALTLSHLDWDGAVQKLVSNVRRYVDEGGSPQPAASALRAAAAAARTGPSVELGSAATISISSSPAGSRMKKGILIGVPLLIAAAVIGYFALRPKPKPNPARSGLVVTIVANKRLTGAPGPLNVLIDGEQQGQIRFNENGSTPIQIHAAEGEHRFTFTNPQTKASCTGTFTVNPNQLKLIPRMRDNGTVCSLEVPNKQQESSQ